MPFTAMRTSQTRTWIILCRMDKYRKSRLHSPTLKQQASLWYPTKLCWYLGSLLPRYHHRILHSPAVGNATSSTAAQSPSSAFPLTRKTYREGSRHVLLTQTQCLHGSWFWRHIWERWLSLKHRHNPSHGGT